VEEEASGGDSCPRLRWSFDCYLWISIVPRIKGLGPFAYVVVLIPKVSGVPVASQSSTSTVKGSVVVPLDLITEAVPVKVACESVPQAPLLMNSPSMDWALIRTPA